MPYKALLWTLVTVGLALIAVTLWLEAVGPLMAGADSVAATLPSNQAGKSMVVAATRPVPAPPEKNLHRLIQGTLILSFVLICLLLLVGLAGASREWIRYRTAAAARREKPQKTRYVDAWKIAGERLKAKPEDPENEEP